MRGSTHTVARHRERLTSSPVRPGALDLPDAGRSGLQPGSARRRPGSSGRPPRARRAGPTTACSSDVAPSIHVVGAWSEPLVIPPTVDRTAVGRRPTRRAARSGRQLPTDCSRTWPSRARDRGHLRGFDRHQAALSTSAYSRRSPAMPAGSKPANASTGTRPSTPSILTGSPVDGDGDRSDAGHLAQRPGQLRREQSAVLFAELQELRVSGTSATPAGRDRHRGIELSAGRAPLVATPASSGDGPSRRSLTRAVAVVSPTHEVDRVRRQPCCVGSMKYSEIRDE